MPVFAGLPGRRRISGSQLPYERASPPSSLAHRRSWVSATASPGSTYPGFGQRGRLFGLTNSGARFAQVAPRGQVIAGRGWYSPALTPA